jgi:hypothetical protein
LSLHPSSLDHWAMNRGDVRQVGLAALLVAAAAAAHFLHVTPVLAFAAAAAAIALLARLVGGSLDRRRKTPLGER